MEYTERLWSTELFRRWSAITAIAGVLERRVWVRLQSGYIYPNLFVFLVGPPASGKTRAASVCEDLWKTLPHTGEYDFHLAPTSLTKASLMDEIAASHRHCDTLPQDMTPYNSLLIMSKELGALIPTYDPDFLYALTFLYDNESYSEKRRSKGIEPISVDRPQINLLGCTQAPYLFNTMPESAWDQGFLSRVIMIYSDIVGERALDLSEEELPRDPRLRAALIHDLHIIAERSGKLEWTRDAGEHLSRWTSDPQHRPTHPRLQHYNTRRPIHAVKLSMIACMERGGTNIIELEDTQTAVEWLLEAEHAMSDLFLAFRSGGDVNVINEGVHYLRTVAIRTTSLIPAHLLTQFLSERVPSYRIQSVMDTMIRANLISVHVQEGVQVLTVVERGATGAARAVTTEV